MAHLRAVAGSTVIAVETPDPGPAGKVNPHAPHGVEVLMLNMTLADLIDELGRPDDSSSRSLYANLQVVSAQRHPVLVGYQSGVIVQYAEYFSWCRCRSGSLVCVC